MKERGNFKFSGKEDPLTLSYGKVLPVFHFSFRGFSRITPGLVALCYASVLVKLSRNPLGASEAAGLGVASPSELLFAGGNLSKS